LNKIRDGLKSLLSPPVCIPGFLDRPYYPFLDGLRGMAIIMVVFFHCQLSGNFFYLSFFSGSLGVEIFFVLSGFLITTLILKEKITTSTISLRKFYIRRAFRILPVAYLYIAVSILLNLIFHTHVHTLIFIASALFILDFSYFRPFNNPYTGHYWSLSVEEQFYILFPVLLKNNWKLYLTAILSVLLLLPLIITAEFLYFPDKLRSLYFLTHFFIKFQGIATGCFLSIICFKLKWKLSPILSLRYLINPAIFAAILLLKFNDFLTIGSMFKDLAISCLIAGFIAINLFEGNDILYRLLTSKMLRIIGILSYSIYIWQQLFTFSGKDVPDWIRDRPYNLLLLAVVSCLSYYLYEKYFLKLKTKFSMVREKRQSFL
jgi:peptidoglycan/LPS O-acetylase OafA/YrhL